jgi:hypothetical protein
MSSINFAKSTGNLDNLVQSECHSSQDMSNSMNKTGTSIKKLLTTENDSTNIYETCGNCDMA